MKQSYFFSTCLLCVIAITVLCIAPNRSYGQATYQPYSYHFYQKLNRTQYGIDSRQHTALKPFLIDSVMRPSYDSLMNLGVTDRDSWGGTKLFNEHLIEVNREGSSFYADILPDLYVGRDFSGGGKNTFLRTVGVQLGGTVRDRFSYSISAYNNRSVFPDYVNEFVNRYEVVPGQTFGDVHDSVQDWNYVTAHLSYTPTKYLNISLAYDKTHIGDGYRSMLLSDVASNYTSLKLTGNLGNVQYMTMWSYMIDPLAPPLVENKMRGKWGAFQYLDWNVSNRFSVGFFQSIIWANRTETDGRRGFEPAYLNPIVFLRPIESSDPGSPDKMHLGLTTKYKVLNNLTAYGQFLLGEFTAKEFFAGDGYAHNKWGAQIGVRGFDAFGVENLNFLGELNMARPYTYTHFDPVSNYSHFSQPLAHPLGANFREVIGIVNYSYQRFDVSLQGNYSVYGLDEGSINFGENETNYGKDIFKSYRTIENMYGNTIGQGLKTNLGYLDGRVSYLLNPKYNLRLELGGVLRRESNTLGRNTSAMLTFGLRSSFRNLYYDF